MAIVERTVLQPLVDDPDDYRPNSRIAVVVDPGGSSGLCAIIEEIAPGDRVPLHRHPVDELLFVLAGSDEVTLGDERTVVGPGGVVFIPAGVVHGQRNVGDDVVHIRAVFPGTEIELEMLDRNPAPGTEDRAPAHVVYDARTGAIREVG